MQILIQPSAMIRRNYNEVARICRESGNPVFLTKNGEEDLVAVAMEHFFRKEQQILLREKLVDIEKRRRKGEKDLSFDAVYQRLWEIIENYRLLELTQESEYPARGEETPEPPVEAVSREAHI